MGRDEYGDLRGDQLTREYADGFGWKAVICMFFVCFLMVPGAIFLSLTTGAGLGAAVNWVTVIIFLELAKRVRTKMTRQETYILFGVSGAALGMASGGFFQGFVWNQFIVQSPAAVKFGLTEQLPIWYAPPLGSEAYDIRSLLHRDWWPCLIMMGVGLLWGQLNYFSLGYALFRITSDVERLPFPLAPITAQGVTALVESDKETWRWKVFTGGSSIGIIFGFIYIGIPSLTQVILGERFEFLPIPFKDLTSNVENVMPATPLAIPTNLGFILTGFVLPFWMVAGSFASAVVGRLIINPFVLHPLGLLPSWQPGSGYIGTLMSNNVDFWMSWGIGTAIAVFFLGFYTATSAFIKAKKKEEKKSIFAPPEGRGDIPILLAILFYVVTTTWTVMLCHWLVPKFPLWILFAFGFIYTPAMSYVTARMTGLTGMAIGSFPNLKEASFVLSGYKGVDIWLAPVPIGDHGGGTQSWRACELTGTKFTSNFKAQICLIPIALTCSLLFWSVLWKMGEIPSGSYPYAQRFWPMSAFTFCLWATATTSGSAFFLTAIKAGVIVCGFIFAMLAYLVLNIFGAPTIFLYGFIGGIAGADPMAAIPQFAAACLGRFYFAKKYGHVQWRQYTPVLAAGFSCGFGLIGMVAVAVELVSKAVVQLPF